MNSSKKILVGGVHPWNSPVLKAGNHHYGELFAKDGYNVCWVSHHVSLPHFFGRHNAIRIENVVRGIRRIDRILTYTPFTLLPYIKIFPFNTVFMGKHHLRFAIPSIRHVLKSHGFHEVDILLINDMSLYYLSEIVKYKTLVLRIVDDLHGLSLQTRSLLKLQTMLIQKADHVFITSKELMKYAGPQQSKFHYLPNAVDPEHFAGTFPLPLEYEYIPSPRVIYVGSLFQWIDRIDMDLLDSVAQSLPSYNFIFIGPTTLSFEQFKNKKNVFFLGPKPYQDIPAYIKHGDVAMIPFKQNDLTKSMSTMKLFQYLAAGLPVVSSRMQELESMNPPVFFTSNNEEFSNALQNAYAQGKNHKEFFEFAQKNSWGNRYETMKSVLGI